MIKNKLLFFFWQKSDAQEKARTLAARVRRSPLSPTEMLSTSFCTLISLIGLDCFFSDACARKDTHAQRSAHRLGPYTYTGSEEQRSVMTGEARSSPWITRRRRQGPVRRRQVEWDGWVAAGCEGGGGGGLKEGNPRDREVSALLRPGSSIILWALCWALWRKQLGYIRVEKVYFFFPNFYKSSFFLQQL